MPDLRVQAAVSLGATKGTFARNTFLARSLF